jgi:hypothetical protein
VLGFAQECEERVDDFAVELAAALALSSARVSRSDQGGVWRREWVRALKTSATATMGRAIEIASGDMVSHA